jgi:hypothetical protein
MRKAKYMVLCFGREVVQESLLLGLLGGWL